MKMKRKEWEEEEEEDTCNCKSRVHPSAPGRTPHVSWVQMKGVRRKCSEMESEEEKKIV